MKKCSLIYSVIVFALVLFSGCNQSEQLTGQFPELFPNKMESLTVTHLSSGTEKVFTLEGIELDALKDWASSLSFREKVTFQDGNYPGQNEEGGELYLFQFNGNDSSLSYRNFGDCYFVVGEDWYLVSNPSNPPIGNTDKLEYDKIPMVMVNGKLYYDTGKESTITRRCGNMDGEITSTVDGTEIPYENNQSNFGYGYGYQYGSDDTIDVYINDKWFVFEYSKGNGNKLRFMDKWYNEDDLSDETLEWLNWYYGLLEEEQLSIDSIPPELIDGIGFAKTEDADTEATTE